MENEVTEHVNKEKTVKVFTDDWDDMETCPFWCKDKEGGLFCCGFEGKDSEWFLSCWRSVSYVSAFRYGACACMVHVGTDSASLSVGVMYELTFQAVFFLFFLIQLCTG